MTSGLERLHHELVQIDEALRAFDAPIVDELSGTRLMRHVLEQRRTDVDDKLRNLQRCQLIIRIDQDGKPDDGVPAALIAELLAALQRGVRELAVELSRDWSPAPDDSVVRDEATLWLVSSGGAPTELTLQFPRRPEEQLVDPTTQSSLLVDVLEAVAAAMEGERPAPALQALAEVVVGRAISLDITTVASGGPSRGVRMDRAAAQRLVAAGAGNDADADDRWPIGAAAVTQAHASEADEQAHWYDDARSLRSVPAWAVRTTDMARSRAGERQRTTL